MDQLPCSPKGPPLKEFSLDDWPLVEDNDFHGSLLDTFQDTSLPLSSTTVETPLNVGFSGGQDIKACILETLFAVFDRGRWIADLNISNLASTKLSRLPRCTNQHANTDGCRPKMVCIDSWLGLISAPEEKVSLFRAHRNWQARVAASSISVALGHDTVLLPEEVCWQCLPSYVSGCFGNVIAIG